MNQNQDQINQQNHDIQDQKEKSNQLYSNSKYTSINSQINDQQKYKKQQQTKHLNYDVKLHQDSKVSAFLAQREFHRKKQAQIHANIDTLSRSIKNRILQEWINQFQQLQQQEFNNQMVDNQLLQQKTLLQEKINQKKIKEEFIELQQKNQDDINRSHDEYNSVESYKDEKNNFSIKEPENEQTKHDQYEPYSKEKDDLCHQMAEKSTINMLVNTQHIYQDMYKNEEPKVDAPKLLENQIIKFEQKIVTSNNINDQYADINQRDRQSIQMGDQIANVVPKAEIAQNLQNNTHQELQKLFKDELIVYNQTKSVKQEKYETNIKSNYDFAHKNSYNYDSHSHITHQNTNQVTANHQYASNVLIDYTANKQNKNYSVFQPKLQLQHSKAEKIITQSQKQQSVNDNTFAKQIKLEESQVDNTHFGTVTPELSTHQIKNIKRIYQQMKSREEKLKKEQEELRISNLIKFEDSCSEESDTQSSSPTTQYTKMFDKCRENKQEVQDLQQQKEILNVLLNNISSPNQRINDLYNNSFEHQMQPQQEQHLFTHKNIDTLISGMTLYSKNAAEMYWNGFLTKSRYRSDQLIQQQEVSQLASLNRKPF